MSDPLCPTCGLRGESVSYLTYDPDTYRCRNSGCRTILFFWNPMVGAEEE